MDQRIIDLYDRFTHGGLTRRAFLDRLSTLAGGTAAAAALLPLLQNNYAVAQTVAESDPRVKTETVMVDPARKLSGYLARPAGGGRFPAVLVIHENRGLNPHIRDIARRLATDGFLALALDYLSPAGGTPEDEDKARDMIGTLKPDDILASSRTALAWLHASGEGNGRAGAVGFCWGGGAVNELAVADPTLDAGVAYYGRQAAAEKALAIRAPLMLHYGGLDERINAGIPAYETALKAAGRTYEIHVYEGANHAFNNDTAPSRYNKEAADLAWSRTVGFLRKNLAA
ncbi:dienelactone hydrolase family protein [Salinarimonas soli]|uniref:Dienelactone hydrolase family protein n=1 Tax=Salinarimonas soli TaxID=1638099 RepID=A0A5B2V9Z5_9HYPH|nr:dienelactone hydrolase family protein [Salinarimonas soli]KAA2235159.1 dienelactone hydrolase family protein [Salinarimonas soli]